MCLSLAAPLVWHSAAVRRVCTAASGDGRRRAIVSTRTVSRDGRSVRAQRRAGAPENTTSMMTPRPPLTPHTHTHLVAARASLARTRSLFSSAWRNAHTRPRRWSWPTRPKSFSIPLRRRSWTVRVYSCLAFLCAPFDCLVPPCRAADPVVLPSSGQTMDRAVIQRHLLSVRPSPHVRDCCTSSDSSDPCRRAGAHGSLQSAAPER